MSIQSQSIKKFWAVIPAAGMGKRMQANCPKQYLKIQNKTVIEHTLDRLLSMEVISGAVISISQSDEYWPELNYTSNKPVLTATGGEERSDSVLNALIKLRQMAEQSTDELQNIWALVHDAARPCVRVADVQKLIDVASVDEEGGLLALAVRDTMKRSNHQQQVENTVDREGLWHALTPQMFRLDLLIEALEHARNKQLVITDDASAMEHSGYHPQLIEAHEDNIKITRAFDLQLAELFMQHQNK